MQDELFRRRFIRDISITASGIIISQWLPLSLVNAQETGTTGGQPSMAIVRGSTPREITRTVIETLGGMKRFVSRHDIVAIKPNIGWDRTPEQAATTDPIIVATLVELALAAGAKEVRIIDNTCNEPRRCYKRSGIEDAAGTAGANVMHFDERKAQMMSIRGEKIKEWLVNRDIYEVDCLINVPIAKHHGLSQLTLGMKNWFGVVGGRRNKLHQDIDTTIVDFAAFFKPKLVVLDAFRILLKNGPQGGNLNDVKHTHTIAAGIDQVAIDAFGSTLFGLRFDDLGTVKKAVERGIGIADYTKLSPRQVSMTS